MDVWPAAARRNAQLAFAVGMPLVCVYMATALCLFHRRRMVMPLRARPFKNVFASQVLIWIYMVELSLTWIARSGHPCVVTLVFGWMTLVPCMNLYLTRVWMLWFAYKSTQQKRHLCQDVKMIRRASALHLASLESGGSATQMQKEQLQSVESPTNSESTTAVSGGAGTAGENRLLNASDAHREVSEHHPDHTLDVSNMENTPTQTLATVPNQSSGASINPSTWYLRNKHYGQDSFIYKVFAIKTGMEELVLISPMFRGTFYTEALGAGVLSVACPSSAWLIWFFMAVVVVNALLMFVAAIKFGEVVDGFYLKSEFKLNALVALFGMVAWNIINLTYNPSPEFPFSTLCMLLILLSVFTASTVYPVWKTRLFRGKGGRARSQGRVRTHSRVYSQTASVTVNSHDTQLVALLRTERGVGLFREHLSKEFSIENLIFWEAVNDFRESFVRDEPRVNQAHAVEIFHRFIEEDSPLQVNIEHGLVINLRQTIFSSNSNEHSTKQGSDSNAPSLSVPPLSPQSQLQVPGKPVPKHKDDQRLINALLFDKTQHAILHLMASDSFLRFKDTLIKSGKGSELESILREGALHDGGDREPSKSK